MTVICVDLSKYQKGFDFAAFKAGGGLGVICKATEGTSIQDSSYKTFRQQAKAAGLAFASYHFFRPSSPSSQANYYLNFAAPDEGERVVCDWEDDKTFVDDVIAFLGAIQDARPDLQLTVYSGHTAKEKLGSTRNAWLADNTSLWIAQYASTVSWPTATWPMWSLWQYSDTGAVPGFNGAVDCNRFNGPDASFLKWIGPASSSAPQPKPEPSSPLVSIFIQSQTPVRVSISGDVILEGPDGS